VWRQVATLGRGCSRGTGIRPRTLHRQPNCAAKNGLFRLRLLHAVATAFPPDERGRPGPGLLAHVLINKYADHLPLYRQSQIFDREGLDLDRSTLADWVGKSAAPLETLADAIGRHVFAGQAIFAHDTTVAMLAASSGKTQTARLWAYARDERPWGSAIPPASRYQFSCDRKGEHPKDHLSGYTGWMHADGYAGFEDLYRSGRIREVACMAHVRRCAQGARVCYR
jgi:transposase